MVKLKWETKRKTGREITKTPPKHKRTPRPHHWTQTMRNSGNPIQSRSSIIAVQFIVVGKLGDFEKYYIVRTSRGNCASGFFIVFNLDRELNRDKQELSINIKIIIKYHNLLKLCMALEGCCTVCEVIRYDAQIPGCEGNSRLTST